MPRRTPTSHKAVTGRFAHRISASRIPTNPLASTHPQLGKGRIVGAKTTNLRAFALSLVGDRADDLVQDTLLRALQKQDRFEPGTNLQAWVFTLMRNLFYSEYRKRKREV